MALVCHECGYGIQNPFYVVALVIHGDSKMAFSEIEYSVCRSDVERLKPRMTSNLGSSPIAYAIDSVVGNKGGPSNYHVIDMAHRSADYKFISKEIALTLLSKTARDLLKNPRFVEQAAEKRPAGWAQKIYEFLLAEQSKNPDSVL